MIAVESKDWIRKNYGTKFTIPKKEEYITSLPKITGEEETYHRELNDYILNKMKVITITTQQKLVSQTYLEALTGRSKSSGKSTD